MLAAYLWDLGQLAKKSTMFIGRQGYQMGRPGQVRVRLEIEKGSMIAARIAGTAIIVSEGTVAL
jgi:predicted PhzF superfamily epimerase YddE/YHI9